MRVGHNHHMPASVRIYIQNDKTMFAAMNNASLSIIPQLWQIAKNTA